MDVDDLRGLAPFAGLTEVGLARLAMRAAELRAAAGRVLALEGDPATDAYRVTLPGGELIEPAPDLPTAQQPEGEQPPGEQPEGEGPGTDVAPEIDAGALGFDRYDVVGQAFTSNHVVVADGRGTFDTIPFRYVWPAELDLMARIAGLEPEHRWADWARAPLTADAEQHVSVWVKPD